MQITIVSATPFEIAPLQHYLAQHFSSPQKDRFQRGSLQIHLLITGVGMPLTALHLGSYLQGERPDLMINAGVAGSFRTDWPLAQVVQVVSDRFGDLGAEEANGHFMDIHEMDLINKNDPPFENGLLRNPESEAFQFLPSARGLTVNKVHGAAPSIAKIKTKYEVDIETMEGAAFFLAARMSQTPFMAIRALSNYVEPRNREAWKLKEAIEQLNAVLKEMVQTFMEQG